MAGRSSIVIGFVLLVIAVSSYVEAVPPHDYEYMPSYQDSKIPPVDYHDGQQQRQPWDSQSRAYWRQSSPTQSAVYGQMPWDSQSGTYGRKSSPTQTAVSGQMPWDHVPLGHQYGGLPVPRGKSKVQMPFRNVQDKELQQKNRQMVCKGYIKKLDCREKGANQNERDAFCRNKPCYNDRRKDGRCRADGVCCCSLQHIKQKKQSRYFDDDEDDEDDEEDTFSTQRQRNKNRQRQRENKQHFSQLPYPRGNEHEDY